MANDDNSVEAILEKIRAARNFDFRNYKRATLARRIERRMTDRAVKSHDDYLHVLDREPHEFDALISSMLIKVTSFFRDKEVWDELSKKIIPAILANKRPQEEVRIWCAGCSTGEEAFSIAILLAEALGPAFSSYDVKIFGTDVDESAVSTARRGTYSEEQVENVPRPLLARYFTRTPDGFTVKQEMRRIVVFGVNNLVSDAPISRLDLLLCRNVFIYLDATLQKRVLTRFHYALSPGGIMVLGRAELIPFATKLFEQVDLGMRIYRKDGRREITSAPERLATLVEEDGLARAAAASTRHETPLGSFYRDVLDASGVPIIATSLDSTITLWNAAAARLWSRPESDMLGKKLSSLVLPGLTFDGILEKTALVRDGKRDHEIVETSPFAQTTFAFDVRAIRDSGREIVGILYVAHDVTRLRTVESEMRHVTDELRSSNERLQSSNEELQTTNEELQSTNEELETTNEELQSANAELDATNRELAHRTEEMHILGLYQRTIIRSLSAGIVVIDAHGKIGSWNLAAERLLGLPEGEALGQTVWTLRIPAISRPLIQRIRRTLAEKRALREENIIYELPSGGRGTAMVAALPLIEGERNLGAVILFEDVTRSAALARENAKLREQVKGAAGVPASDRNKRTRRPS